MMRPCMPFLTQRVRLTACLATALLMLPHAAALAMPPTIARGQTLPDAVLVGANNVATSLDDLKGRVKIFSIVPQLNTPVCDEQTHRFSEHKTAEDTAIEIVTISTNTHDDQAAFADNAGIANVTFLSDAPRFDFGTATGLLYPSHRILQRAVMVVDERNVVRYLDITPMGQVPDVEAAMRAARTLLSQAAVAVPARNDAPPPRNPHADPSESMAPPPGIIGVALHLTAERVGGPAGVFIRVAHPMGPAAKAGLTHGQEILAVDGRPLNGKTYREVVAMIRGAVGTPVTLRVKTPAAVNDVEIVRVDEERLLKTHDNGAARPGPRRS